MTETMDNWTNRNFSEEKLVTFPEQICLLYISVLSHALIPTKQRKKQCEKQETAPKKPGSETYIFPANILSAATAENISNGVHTRKHHPFL